MNEADRIDPLEDPRGWLDPARPPAWERRRPETASLEDRVETLERQVASLQSSLDQARVRRSEDRPAIEFAERERRRYEFGKIAGLVVGIPLFLFLIASQCAR